MQDLIKLYKKNNLVTFSIDIKQKKHKSGKWKKEIGFPSQWTDFTLKNYFYNEKYNGIALLTGKINNIIVIDIDNKDHWDNLLKENNQKEPDTVKVISGSGGIHYYFKYDESLETIKSKDHCFGKEYDIDIKTNGGCVIAPPTKYFNNNLNKEVVYQWATNSAYDAGCSENDQKGVSWKKSVFDYNITEIPIWIKNLLLNRKTKKELKKELKFDKIELKTENKIECISKIYELQNLEILPEDSELNFTINDIEILLDMLDSSRCDNYNDWLNVGMCLNNIDSKYMLLWIKWSQQSIKYEDGTCEEKWKSFKKDKSGLKIGSLLMWAKNDNIHRYEDFMKRKKMNKMILSKYPNEKLILGDTQIINNRNYYTHLKNKECLIKGCEHPDMPTSMYIDIIDKFMTIKCRHSECFGKTYPCQHILMNKNEVNIAFNGDVTININNNNGDDELVEFQQINIYEDEKLNELIYNSLNGETSQLAKIIYYFYKNEYNFGEDNNWYIFEDHKWKNIGPKNSILRNQIEIKLKELYSKLFTHYKENEYDKNKIKTLKNVMKSFGETTQKNNILVEVNELFIINNNKNRDFVKKMDSNKNLIGFENGVYDLQNFEFREGVQSDILTLSTGYNFNNTHTDKYNGLIKFLEDIQPNKEERDYMLTYLSIGLMGNLLELFTILTGCGRNGKSKLIELLKVTFGDYFGSVQSQLFTRPRPDANSPDPGLLSLAKKRIVIASEPEKNSKLNSGFIKFITGRDSTTLRNCHSNDMVDFTANFITLLICNDIPECDDLDNAFTKRLRCINFPTEFVLEPTKNNQKKIDTNINENFKYWNLDFILLLIEYYKKYQDSKQLKPTDNIMKWTNQYKEDTDIYLQFLNENTEENTEGHIHCSTLYDTFKEWYKNNNPHSKIPSNREFVNNLRKHKDIIRVRVGDDVNLGIKNLKLKDSI